MEHFHVYAKYRDSQGKSYRRFGFGYSLEKLRKTIVEPYNENKPFWLVGSRIYPSQVELLFIFRSSENKPQNIILPNGKTAIDEENFDYIVKCFLRRNIPSIFGDSTHNFIIPAKGVAARSI